MKEKIRKINVFEIYYPVVLIGYAASMISREYVHPGIIAGIMLLAAAAELIIKKRMPFSRKDIRTEDAVMYMFLAYSLLSGIWTVVSGIPFRVYAGEAFTTAIPMIFYFVGRADGENTKLFYRIFAYSVIGTGILGLILYITAPQFYLDFLMNVYISKADAATMRVRMHSVIGSTLLGYLSVASMFAGSYFIIRSELKKNRELDEGVIIFATSMMFAFLSNQRAAMVVAILAVIYMNHLIFFTFNMLPKRYFAAEAGSSAAGVAVLCIADMGIVMKIYYRLVSVPGAIGQRSDQWVGAVNNMKNMWIGNGLGANGTRAFGYQDHVIADGGLAKLYCEMGIIGTTFFIFLMLLVLRKGFRKLKECAPETGLIVMTLLVAIGSDMLSFQLATPIFYFAVGRIVHICCTDSQNLY